MRARYIVSLCVLLAAVVVTGAVLLAAYGILRHVSISVTDASLTRFSLVTSPATALAYNLSLTLAVRNPNWAINVKNKEPLEAAYSFDGQQFERVQVSDEGYKQPARTTRVYRLVTGSDSDYVALGNAGVAEYKTQNATGTFEVEVKLTGEFSYTLRYTKCKLEATCPLKLQLLAPSSGSGTPATVVFEKVKCKLAKPEKYC
uniref:Uncharacterized protein n=1 Tax=Avena sativa TaxID=4498 RepID=A0ACD5ZNU2_AVESA